MHIVSLSAFAITIVICVGILYKPIANYLLSYRDQQAQSVNDIKKRFVECIELLSKEEDRKGDIDKKSLQYQKDIVLAEQHIKEENAKAVKKAKEYLARELEIYTRTMESKLNDTVQQHFAASITDKLKSILHKNPDIKEQFNKKMLSKILEKI